MSSSVIRLLAFALLTFLSLPVSAQVALSGNVAEADGSAAQYMNVALFPAADSLNMACGGITDETGHFALLPVRPGAYVVVISAVGYETLRQDVRLRMPSAGTTVVRSFTVKRANVELDEVQATASRKTESAGKSSYTFSRSQIDKSRHAADLISGIDELRIDPQTDRIALASAKPGELKILINGVAATDEDLKAIDPDKVVRCDYFSIPPARYSSVAAVVNVFTKPLDDGWAAGASATSALTTGFVNASAYARLFRGPHQFGIDYALNYRDYTDRRSQTTYAFDLADGHYDYAYNSRGSFGYVNNQIRLKYLCITSKGTVVQAIIKPDFLRRWANGDNDARIAQPDTTLFASGVTRSRLRTFGPSADLYFSRKFREQDKLDLNIVGTYFTNKQTELSNLDADNLSIVSDDMEQRTDKKSLIAEAAYTLQFNALTSLTFGYKATLARSSSTISNVLSAGRDYDYASRSYAHYAYADFAGSFRHASLRAALGLTSMGASNDRADYRETFFTPTITASFPFGRHTLQLSFQGQATAPTISQLADNATLVAPRILRTGTPSLRAATFNVGTLSYIFNSRFVDLSVSALAGTGADYITKSFSRVSFAGGEALAISSVNGDRETDIGCVAQVVCKPLGSDALQLQANVTALNSRQKVSGIGSYHRWYLPIKFSATYKTDRWGVSYQGAVTDLAPSGPYLDSDEPQSHIQAHLQIRRVRLKAGCLWLFSQAKYESRTISNPMLAYSSNTSIRDNRNMLTLGLSIDLSGGKGRDNVNLKFHNADTDRGDF